jgi:hypothetical protein
VVYSEVDADTFNSPGLTTSPYRRGRYMVANLVYATQVPAFSATPPATPPSQGTAAPKPGNLFTGIEFLYGERENLNGATGADQRIQFTFAVRF